MAQAVRDDTIGWRRALHRIPEVRWEESQTLATIRSVAEALVSASPLRDKVEMGDWKGGLVIDVTAAPGAGRILFRADVDGLEIREDTGLPYASEHPGFMHACGHDMHAAMLLGALAAICRSAEPPGTNLRCVFQRAEENPVTQSGGACLVSEGVLQGVTEAHALHVWATSPLGRFESRPGAAFGNSDRLRILIETSGGHVATPGAGVNALDIVTDILIGLREYGEHTLGPKGSFSLAPAIVKAGTASNVRPATAEMWFAARNLLPPGERARFHEALTDRVHAIAARYRDPRLKVTVNVIRGHPMLENSVGPYERVRHTLERAGMTTAVGEPLLAGEDFAYYLEAQGGVPGALWLLGANQPACGDLHTPKFNPDERALEYGVLFWLLLAYGK